MNNKENIKFAEKILKNLLSTSFVTSGAVAEMSSPNGFPVLRTKSVISKADVLQVFNRYGVNIKQETDRED